MTKKNQALMEARAVVVKALAHPTRLAVVHELGKGERCVGDLQALVDCDLSTMSKHLSILRSVGIVQTDKRGVQVFYRLSLPCLTKLFACIDEVLGHDARRRTKVCS